MLVILNRLPAGIPRHNLAWNTNGRGNASSAIWHHYFYDPAEVLERRCSATFGGLSTAAITYLLQKLGMAITFAASCPQLMTNTHKTDKRLWLLLELYYKRKATEQERGLQIGENPMKKCVFSEVGELIF